ncbi:hypothetical protein GCM10009678_72170 [Actinomadura kijaniata]
MLFYRAALPLSCSTLTYLAGMARRDRAKRGAGRHRAPPPGQQALMTLVYPHKGETFAALTAGFGSSTATAWRYINHTVILLAARAPKLAAALRATEHNGHPYLVLDGTLIAIDQVAADRPLSSGRHKKHGVNLQVIAAPTEELVWVSGTLPDSVTTPAPPGSGACPACCAPPICWYWPTRVTRAWTRPSRPTKDATSPSRRKRPTARTPKCAGRVSAPTRN